MQKLIIIFTILIYQKAISQLDIDLEKIDINNFPKLYYFADLKVNFIGKYRIDSTSEYELVFEKLFILAKNKRNEFFIESNEVEFKTNYNVISVFLKSKKSNLVIKTFKATVSKEIYMRIESELYDKEFNISRIIDTTKSYNFRLVFSMPKNYYLKIYKPLMSFRVQQTLIDKRNEGKQVSVFNYEGWYDTGYSTNFPVYLKAPYGLVNRFCFIDDFKSMGPYSEYGIRFQLISNQPKCINIDLTQESKKTKKIRTRPN